MLVPWSQFGLENSEAMHVEQLPSAIPAFEVAQLIAR